MALKEILHCYIESGMVVAVGLRNSNKRGHSLICIGRGSIDPNMIVSELIPVNVGKDVKECYVADTSSGCTDYVVMDDNMVPYSQCKIETQKGCWNHRTKHYEENTFLSYSENDICKKYAIECIVVPMSKRMYLEAADAREIFRTVATDFEIGIKSWCDNIRNNFEGVDLSIIGTNIGNVSDDPIVMRVFLATSRSYKRNRREVFSNNTAIRDMYCSIAMPKYVWVCELYTKETLENNQVIGEIVVDATAAAHIGDKLDAILLLHYPHKIVSRDLHEKREDFLKKLRDEGDYYGWKPWNPFHFHSKVLFNVNN